MEINAIGILGAGETGSGLAELLIGHGLQVRLYDGFKDRLALAMAKIAWSLKGQGKAGLLGSLEAVQDMAKFRGADMVLEAGAKSPEEQKVYFGKLLPHLEQGCLLALRCPLRPLAGAIAECGLPPERTLGLNFSRPVRSNQLAEVVRTDRTGDALLDSACGLLRRIGKIPVIVKDNPGQIAQRLSLPFYLGALRLLEAGKGTPHEIDSAFCEVSGAAEGPFAIADRSGLDKVGAASDYLYSSLGRPERLLPSQALLRLVQYGQMGRRSTIGFYLYQEGRIAGENPILPNLVKYLGLRKAAKEEIFADIMRPVIEEARLLAVEVMASEYDIETAAKLALGWPKGPFACSRDFASLLEKKQVSEFDKLDPF